MKALFIGGTGTISTEISRLCVRKGWDLTLLNRGRTRDRVPEGASVLVGDIHNEAETAALLKDRAFDVVADFIAFTPADVERDIRLFSGRTGQYIFISSASAYQKPLVSPWITESTPLCNPYWEYSRNKIRCEELLVKAGRESGFPFTVVRPSHTYCERGVPVAIHGPKGSFQVLERMRLGKPVPVPGDGTTLWTLTHSRDFAVAFEGLMGNPHTIGDCYQITSDEMLTWNQVYAAVGRALGAEPKLVHLPSDLLGALYPDLTGNLLGDKANNAMFDNTKIKRAVPAFNATIRFDRGAAEAVKYVYSHPECQIPDPAFDAWCDSVITLWEKTFAEMPRFGA